MNIYRKPLLGLFWSATVLIWMALSTSVGAAQVRPADAGDAAAVDLTVEISSEPTAPGVEEEATVRVQVRNLGSTVVDGSFRVHLYLDPPEQPPAADTPDSFFWQLPGLGANGVATLERTHAFATVGDHAVYAWVDRDGATSDGNPANNLVGQTVCVGEACAQPTVCVADAFEQDNLCSAASWLGEDVAQTRSLCHASDVAQPDVDWVKFTAFDGLTYTLALDAVGADIEPGLAIYNGCAEAAPVAASSDATLAWRAPSNGIFYARVQTGDASAPAGGEAGYRLGLASASSTSDAYEPNNQCADARDIATDGTRQTHRFAVENDVDWVKFAVQAGESFTLVADRTGAGVSPVVALFASCSKAESDSALNRGPNSVTASANVDQLFYARITNADASVYGAAATYDLSVLASTCVADDFGGG